MRKLDRIQLWHFKCHPSALFLICCAGRREFGKPPSKFAPWKFDDGIFRECVFCSSRQRTFPGPCSIWQACGWCPRWVEKCDFFLTVTHRLCQLEAEIAGMGSGGEVEQEPRSVYMPAFQGSAQGWISDTIQGEMFMETFPVGDSQEHFCTLSARVLWKHSNSAMRLMNL